MKLIIAGSRNVYPSIPDIRNALLDKGLYSWVDEIVSGGARGADRAGELYAKGCDLRLTQFLPDWENDGHVAGVRRNIRMADYADALLAFWDGESKGTANMILAMHAQNKPVHVVVVTR